MSKEEHYLVRLKGKVVRDGGCPLKKGISCEDCDDYDGWGIDIEEHRPDIWCTNPKIVDGNKLTLTPQTDNNKKKRVLRWKKKLIRILILLKMKM